MITIKVTIGAAWVVCVVLSALAFFIGVLWDYHACMTLGGPLFGFCLYGYSASQSLSQKEE